MTTKMVIKIRKIISNLHVMESIIGLLYRKEFLSKNITQILTTKDIINASDNYLSLIGNKELFKDIKEGIPGVDFQPGNFLSIKYEIDRGSENDNENASHLVIFSYIPRRSIFSHIESYFFDEKKSENTSLYVIYNSSLVLKSFFPISDIDYYKNRYGDLKLSEEICDDDFINNPKEWLDNQGYNRLAKDDKKLKKNFEKVKSMMIDDYMSSYNYNSSSASTFEMKIQDYIFDSISVAKLGEWVSEIFQLIKNEIEQDVSKAKNLKEEEILATKKLLDKRMRKKHKIEKDTEKDFDIGPF